MEPEIFLLSCHRFDASSLDDIDPIYLAFFKKLKPLNFVFTLQFAPTTFLAALGKLNLSISALCSSANLLIKHRLCSA